MINPIQYVKLLVRKDKELYLTLHKILGIWPRDIEIYRCALAHRSLGLRDKKGHHIDNERLEFLGDAIIEATVTDIIFRHFGNKKEGFLTNTRSKLVGREMLGRLAKEIGLEQLVTVVGHTANYNSYAGGNAFEAIVGAIYLDKGYDTALNFMQKQIVERHLNIDRVARKEVNFKSKLIEWSQHNRLQLEFQVVDTKNPGTDSPVFTTQVRLENVAAGSGVGFSKKESQQKAAKDAIRSLQKQSLVASILESKEKRTAMEADLVSAPPRIERRDDDKPTAAAAQPNRQRSRRQRQSKPAAASESQASGGKSPRKPQEGKPGKQQQAKAKKTVAAETPAQADKQPKAEGKPTTARADGQ